MLEFILKRIEIKREQMIQSALEKGILNKDTISLSKELDMLLNELQREETQKITIKNMNSLEWGK